jgi:hypothetical protein
MYTVCEETDALSEISGRVVMENKAV